MPIGFDPQRPPSPFPRLDLLESRVPSYAYPAFGVVGLIVGYFIGSMQDALPLALCAALGALLGLLAVPLFLMSIGFILSVALIALAGVLTFWMMSSGGAQKHGAASAAHASPAKTAHRLLDELIPAVR